MINRMTGNGKTEKSTAAKVSSNVQEKIVEEVNTGISYLEKLAKQNPAALLIAGVTTGIVIGWLVKRR